MPTLTDREAGLQQTSQLLGNCISTLDRIGAEARRNAQVLAFQEALARTGEIQRSHPRPGVRDLAQELATGLVSMLLVLDDRGQG